MKVSDITSNTTTQLKSSEDHGFAGGATFFTQQKKEPFFSGAHPSNENSFFSGNILQPKLTIGQPGDKYEQEADAMADKVVQKMGTPMAGKEEEEVAPKLQRKCAACEKEEGIAPKLQRKAIFESNEEPPVQQQIQRKCAACEANDPLAPQINKMDEEEDVAPKLQKQEEEEEAMMPKLQMQEEEEEAMMPKLQMQEEEEEEEEEAMMPKLQMQEEEEEAMMPKLQMQEEEEEAMMPKLQMQEEEEEAMMPKLQMQEEEAMMPKLQMQEEEEEGMMPKLQMQEEEEEAMQTKLQMQEEVTPKLQAKASSDLESRLNATKGGGSPLPDDTRGAMESGFGADFSNVKVHTDSSSVRMNQELGAQAFTHGSDIYFNSGKYDTGSSDGQKLLAHELTHTIQQGASSAKDGDEE